MWAVTPPLRCSICPALPLVKQMSNTTVTLQEHQSIQPAVSLSSRIWALYVCFYLLFSSLNESLFFFWENPLEKCTGVKSTQASSRDQGNEKGGWAVLFPVWSHGPSSSGSRRVALMHLVPGHGTVGCCGSQTRFAYRKPTQYGCPLPHLAPRPGDVPGSSRVPISFRLEGCGSRGVPRAVLPGTFMVH